MYTKSFDYLPGWNGCVSLIEKSTQPNTIGKLSKTVLLNILSIEEQNECSRIVFITNNYVDISVKSSERAKRASVFKDTSPLNTIADSTRFGNWTQFFSNCQNKKLFVAYLFSK